MSQLVEQPTGMPTRKVTFAAVGGAVATIVVYLVGTYGGVELGEVMVGAITTVVAGIFAYMAKERA